MFIPSKTILVTVLFALALVGKAVQARDVPVAAPTMQAQGQPPANQAAATKPVVPLELLVTIARYEGEKQVSSQPFTLWVNADDGQSTRLVAGQQVPIPQTVFSSPGNATPTRSFNYQNIGTTIEVRATTADDGRFRVDLEISDSSVVPSKESDGLVTLKSLQSHNLLLLRDGQSAEFVAASDKVNGEVTRIAVRATVLK